MARKHSSDSNMDSPPDDAKRGYVLTINGGSSSLKFALYPPEHAEKPEFAGRVERIGFSDSRLFFRRKTKNEFHDRQVSVPDHAHAVALLIEIMEKENHSARLSGVGHRVVHGGPRYSSPQRVTAELMRELHRISPFSPEHLPAQIQLIESLINQFPDIPQVACFDTSFHANMPRVARILPIPRRFLSMGVQRYGFHGLSYEFLMDALNRANPEAAKGRVILAHLGNGASLAAVRDGRCIDTSMGFTPAAGLPMSTRTGDLDPGLVLYLARHEHLSTQQFHELVNRESGLLGVSETSSDIRDLLALESNDQRAADAIELFCYQTKKWIGAFAAALGGLDTLVFAGGIGENAAVIRKRICGSLCHLGIELDDRRNSRHAPIISNEKHSATVRVITTNEEEIIARSVWRLLNTDAGQPASESP